MGALSFGCRTEIGLFADMLAAFSTVCGKRGFISESYLNLWLNLGPLLYAWAQTSKYGVAKEVRDSPSDRQGSASADKTVATAFFFYRRNVFHIEFWHEHHTTNAAYECDILSEGKLTYPSEMCGQSIWELILLHDSLNLHSTREKVEKKSWTTVDNPPYSLDLSPCVIHLLGSITGGHGDPEFSDDNAVDVVLRNWLLSQPFMTRISKTSSQMLNKMHFQGRRLR